MKPSKASKIGGTTSDGTDKLEVLSDSEWAVVGPKVSYVSIGDSGNSKGKAPWRIYFELLSDPSVRFGLDILGEVVLGRGPGAENVFDLTPYSALDLGVSRRHVLLRPTATKLYIIDQGSTNGTFHNGQSIGVNTPYSLADGDTLTLGRMRLITRIVRRPHGHTTSLRKQADIASALMEIADSITSQIEIDEVLNQITETSMAVTSAEEVGVWLVDEKSGEVFLEAQRGIDEDQVKRLRLPVNNDSAVAQVLKTAQPLRASRAAGGEPIKIKTDYFVQSIVYVPLTLGGVTFGVLSAARRDGGGSFDERDERFLGVVAHFAAIALQNARLFHLTDAALEKRVSELAALNELSQAVSSSLDLNVVITVLLEQLQKHWHVDVAGLWLARKHGKGGAFAPAPGSKVLPEGDASALAISRLVSQSAESGEPVLANDVTYQPRTDKSPRATIMVAGSAVCVPLKVQGQVAGVLVLFKKGQARFTEEDVARLQAFANPVATAIHNARLFAESEHERATVRATANTLSQPLLILGEDNEIIIANDAAKRLLESDMSAVFEGIRNTLGRTAYVKIGDRSFLTSVHLESGIGIIAVMQDATDFLKAEERLRESEERYRTLVETSPEAIIVTNLGGKVMVCNQQAAELYGLKSPQEAIGMDSYEFFAPEDRKRAEWTVANTFDAGTIRNVESVILRSDGKRCPVQLSVSVLRDRAQKPIGFIEVAWDISHIKKLEQAREDFVHALSHDLKGPLAAIKGWTDLLQREPSLNGQSAQFLAKIRRASDTTVNMIDQLLDIASLSEVPNLHLAPCDLDEIVGKAVSDLEGTALAKSIAVKTHIIGERHPVMGDQSRLYRSVLNLLDNAIKYSEPKTSITVTLDFGGDTRLAIRDGGPGIAEADLPHVFEKYFRGEATAGEKAGAGLGLATVQAAIQAHGGTVTVENASGGGAEFTVTLPARLSRQAAPAGLAP